MLWRNKRSSGPALKPRSFIEPCLASEADRPPAGDDWVHEIKHDGYRTQMHIRDGRVRLFTRRGFDWTERYPLAVAAGGKLKVVSVTIDCELIVEGPAGISDFALLHSRCHDHAACLIARPNSPTRRSTSTRWSARSTTRRSPPRPSTRS
jgi:ATP-dependent DNA ligase